MLQRSGQVGIADFGHSFQMTNPNARTQSSVLPHPLLSDAGQTFLVLLRSRYCCCFLGHGPPNPKKQIFLKCIYIYILAYYF